MRSRLEADWAATLDQFGITWQYEPEGYHLSDGDWYSPDFWLPSARAWLEVKGSHMERFTKVERFAADLWAESGATCTYDREAPLVLVGRESDPRDHPENSLHINLIGVMGFGKRFSVAMARCPACLTGTVIPLWSPLCRNCHTIHDDPHDAWFNSVTNNWWRGFTKVLRPAGRRP